MAGGNFGGGDGGSLTPFLIEDVYDLDAIRTKNSGLNFKQVNDIDASAISNFTPIASADGSANFVGSYDGAGFTISNLKINYGYNGAGLFTYLNTSSMIKNVHLVNCDITGTATYTGGIVGNNASGLIKNCSVKGSVKGTKFVGGIVGVSHSNPNLGVHSCFFDGHVFGTESVGGIAGYFESKDLYNASFIKDCYSLGIVEGDTIVGGVVGQISRGWTSVHYIINNCYSTSHVVGSSSVGGIAGKARYSGIENCFALNSQISRKSGSSSGTFGDIIGFLDTSGTSRNCFSLDTLQFVQL